jgi:hypothetical protein
VCEGEREREREREREGERMRDWVIERGSGREVHVLGLAPLTADLRL